MFPPWEILSLGPYYYVCLDLPISNSSIFFIGKNSTFLVCLQMFKASFNQSLQDHSRNNHSNHNRNNSKSDDMSTYRTRGNTGTSRIMIVPRREDHWRIRISINQNYSGLSRRLEVEVSSCFYSRSSLRYSTLSKSNYFIYCVTL